MEIGADFVRRSGDLELTGSELNYQFRNTVTNAAGDVKTSISRFDVNLADDHVVRQGTHMNLESHLNGDPTMNLHLDIDPNTILPGDIP